MLLFRLQPVAKQLPFTGLSTKISLLKHTHHVYLSPITIIITRHYTGSILRINFALEAWCAFSPHWLQHQEIELLDLDTATDVKFLPAIKRRRLSALSRLCLRLAHTIVPEYQGKCVFGSQHGELVTTQGLLQSIVAGEVVSPAGFSASVHNTAVGLHSINNQNTAACTSIAAGVDTLAMCFVEAYGLLKQDHLQQVLVVFADDVLPDELAEFVSINQLHGFAALVRLYDESSGTGLKRMQLAQIEKKVEIVDKDPISPLIGCLIEGHPMCSTKGEINDWNWQFDVK